MPMESSAQQESDRDRDREEKDTDRGERSERGGSKQKSSASSKTKDLSHVPCKFYKVGGCTAGSSCPFSHSTGEPGAQKETCTWFVKGNCKFGHKCALAHILPGQSMAMDRKNKKAAQSAVAATATAGAGADKGTRSGVRGAKRELATGGTGTSGRLPLLAGGSTAPTRILGSGSSASTSSGRPPINMQLKATISPSAPAPPLKDTDFTSFAALDEMEGVHLPSPSQQPGTSEDALNRTPPAVDTNLSKAGTADTPITLPPRISNDFGPIGSPPNYRSPVGTHTSPSRINGKTFSPGTSPRAHSQINGVNTNTSPNDDNNTLSTSPFSAPVGQNTFASPPYTPAGGIAASLGSGIMMGGRKGWGDVTETGAASVGASSFSGMLSSQLSSSVTNQRTINGPRIRGEYDISIEYDEFGGSRRLRDVAVEDEDLEDFLPSSLTDLLTPEERNRRMSRSNSGQGSGAGHLSNALATASTAASNQPPVGNGNLGHRYSRSVPAPTLLGDIKSIWADTSAQPMPNSPPSYPTHRGTPSASYSSRFDSMGANSMGHGEEFGLSMSMGSAGTASSLGMISPSNASAAFLPGLHHHYFNAKVKQAQTQQQAQLGHGGVGRALRGASSPLFTNTNTGGTLNSSVMNNYLQPLGGMGVPSSASNSSSFHTHTHGNTQTTYRTTPSPFDLTQNIHQPQPQNSRPIPSAHNNPHLGTDDPLLAPHAMSPSARALQAHAPGQSLPQGLAAGYSRIHALPPIAGTFSPPTSGSFVPESSPGATAGSGHASNEGDWPNTNVSSKMQPTITVQSPAQGGGVNLGSGLDSVFSRLSYSATTPRPGNNPPPGLTRNVSGGRYSQQQGTLSPLSRPVGTRDDDDLFDMDK